MRKDGEASSRNATERDADSYAFLAEHEKAGSCVDRIVPNAEFCDLHKACRGCGVRLGSGWGWMQDRLFRVAQEVKMLRSKKKRNIVFPLNHKHLRDWCYEVTVFQEVHICAQCVYVCACAHAGDRGVSLPTVTL